MKAGRPARRSEMAGKMNRDKTMNPRKMGFTNPGPTKGLRGVEANTARSKGKPSRKGK